MRTTLTTISAILASLTVAGCLPIPWTYYQAPAITGQLRSTEVPLLYQTVFLAEPDSTHRCNKRLASALTDSLGRFQLPAQKQRMHFLPLLGDVWQGWTLCAMVEGHELRLTQAASMRMEKHADVQCSLYRLRDSTTTSAAVCSVRY